MSDDNKGLDNPDLDALKKELEETKKQAEEAKFYKEEAKRAFEKRDAVKKQLEEIEKKKLEEDGKYKELYEAKEKEFSETFKTLEQLKAERDEAVKVKDSFIETTRNELLKDLPDEHKELAKQLDLESLRKYVELNGKKQIKTDKMMDVNKVKTTTSYSNNPWVAELAKIRK